MPTPPSATLDRATHMPAAANSPATPDRRLLARALHVEVPEVSVRFCWRSSDWDGFRCGSLSTVAREAGSLWGTLVLASAALLLAVTVAAATTPRTPPGPSSPPPSARLLRWQIQPHRYPSVIDRAAHQIAALNTGNNLLYIIVAAMLAAILVSGVSLWFCATSNSPSTFPNTFSPAARRLAESGCAIRGVGCRRFP